ncbi:MAG: PhoX family phosphatase [Gammaproteobacteria bacterium]|nr:PhoX family phosphatase [Gammaproteobacteria bacterium]
MSDHNDDISTNTSNNPSFDSVLQQRLSRRGLLRGTAGAAALAIFGSVGAACASAGTQHGEARGHRLQLGFDAVPKSKADVVTLPSGYHYDVLYRLGDPIAAGVAAYLNNGADEPASFAQRGGDHHDGMQYFGLGPNGKHHKNGSDRGLLCINHEAITPAYLHPTGPTIVADARTDAGEVLREFYAHGISVIEAVKQHKKWSYQQDSRFNRRIHTLSDIELSGPAAKMPYMITKYSPDGAKTRGTVNNCANGYTPWGTYLTCEENWAGYFRRIVATDNPNRTAKELTSFARDAIAGTGRELWATVTPDTADNLYGRWNAMKLGSSSDGSDDYRNVANTFGWVVEIDPFDPTSTPKKRTALGRFAHEGAWLGPVKTGKPLVWYMGCDSRNEYIYKYVSHQPWNPADANDGRAAGDKYLNDGKLYVAKFNADGNGEWVELRFGANGITATQPAYPFADQADVLVNARLAADAAGATKMDRPEWGAVNPNNGEVYFTLTNNNAASRPLAKVDAANPRFYNDKKTTSQDQKGNPNGHIIRFAENGGDVDATSFKWDVFLFGARATADANVNLSGLTDANDFSSPDGLRFSNATPGLLWIETDDSAYTDVTNCMLLAAIPGEVGDGAARTVTNVDGAVTTTVDTYVGKLLGDEKLRRFLVGPKECEITGIAETPDGKTLFINIQHPGEDTKPDFATSAFGSHWPEGSLARPRSATIAISRDDGDIVGR